MIHALIKESVG